LALFAEIREVLALIPGTVWAAAVSAGVTLLTVSLTERRNIKRARDQREHEAAEKARDRTMTLRREVYLPVMAEYNSAMAFLANLPSHTTEMIARAEPLISFSTAASKLGLVASTETAIMVHKLTIECAALKLRFSETATEAAQLRHVVEVRDKLRDGYVGEMGRINVAVKSMNESGERDDRRFTVLTQQYGFTQNLFDRETENIDALVRKHREIYAKFGVQFLPALRDLLDISIRTMVAMRRDLGQEGESEVLMREMKSNADRFYAIAQASLRRQLSTSHPELQNNG
jgi:hypothetical protein